MEIGQHPFFVRIGVGKTLEILDDPAHAREAFERFVDQDRRIVAQVIEFEVAAQLLQLRVDRKSIFISPHAAS